MPPCDVEMQFLAVSQWCVLLACSVKKVDASYNFSHILALYYYSRFMTYIKRGVQADVCVIICMNTPVPIPLQHAFD